MSLQLQPQSLPQKVTLQLREGIKAKFFIGSIKEIKQLQSDHSVVAERQSSIGVPPPPLPPEIRDKEFYECEDIIDIEINDLYERIGNSAFYNCVNLKSVSIGKNLKSICDKAFLGCAKLNQIKFNGSVQEWKSIGKGVDWDAYTGDYTVICTDGKIPKVKVDK